MDPIGVEIETQIAALKLVCERLGVVGIPTRPIQNFIRDLESRLWQAPNKVK